MKKLFPLLLLPGVFLLVFVTVLGQESPTQQPTAEELEKQKAERSKNAYQLLEQVISEAQALRLTENRVRVQINAADMLWEHDESRARSLFTQAADGVAEMMRAPDQNSRQNQQRRPTQLRQELVLTAARHDAPLAYQLLAATRPAAPATPAPVDPRNPRVFVNSEDSLEQSLLARVAALDPKLAAQNAEQMLEKGQYPRSITDVITNLQKQDPEAAAKLTDKTIKRIQGTNILTNNEAATLALALVAPGPRQQSDATATTQNTTSTQPQQRTPVLDQSAYTDMLSTVIDSALKATPQQQNNQRGPNQQRARPQGGGGPGGANQNGPPQPPTEAQVEQTNSRRLLGGLQSMLSQIDLYLPARAQAVRMKLTELGMNDNSRQNLAQIFSQMAGGNVTSASLMEAATSMPPPMQPRIYQEAASRALDEDKPDLARQIANEHLQGNARDAVLQKIDFRELAKKAEGARIDEIRQNLARLPSDNDRIDLLLQMAGDLQKTNPKLVRQLLEEAKQITSHRAANYEQFEQQLKVAHAFTLIEPARSFEVLEPGISQLNELLSAAALLSGFEVNIFRDGELPLQGGGGLTATVSRYGQELALLARNDFERSETLAGRFQLAEPRIMARLSIVQGLLGREVPQQNINTLRGFGQTFTFRQE